DQETNGIQEPVIPVDRDRTGDAEKRRRREVVTRDRDAILWASERTPGGVVIRRGPGVAAGPEHNPQRDHDEHAEGADVEDGVAALNAGGEAHHQWVSPSIPARILSATGSSLRLAYHTYRPVITKVDRNCRRPKTRPTVMFPNSFALMKP